MTTRMLVRVSLAVAVAAVLKAIVFFHLPQGGSISLAAWAPIMLVAFKGGKRAGLLAGLGYAFITMLMDPYFVHPVQILLDYILAGLVLAIPAYFPRSLTLGVVVATVAKFLCHWLSGVVFFGSFAPAGTPVWLYSLVYNGPTAAVEGALALAVLLVLHWSGALQRIWPSESARGQAA